MHVVTHATLTRITLCTTSCTRSSVFSASRGSSSSSSPAGVGRNTSSRWPRDTTMKRARSFSCSLQVVKIATTLC